jgi:serine/threonine protein kinase
MDLKPANILIQHDKTSKVGRWMISDFGISVFKEETKPQAAPIGSIGDYYSQLTINTRPKRHEGTYQAPDVMREGIGRKSDIWSYGCILTEVLAFALGSAGLVTGFQSARESGERNDYFYSEVGISQAYLTVPATTRPRYIVRPSVLKWLEDICKNSANPQRWVDCYVETAKKIILIDVDKRPDSTVVLTLVEHVLKHVQDSRLGSPVDCHVLKLNNEDYIVPGPQSPGTETEHPELDKSSTNIQNPTAIPPTIWDDNQESIGKRKDALVTVTEDEVTTPPPPTTNPTHGRSSPLSDGSDQTISGPEPEEKSIVSDPTTSTVTGFSTTSTPYAKPANRHGVTMEDKVVMSPKISICVAVPKQKKWSKATWVSVTSLNGSNKEVRVAYLVKSVVYLYRINFQDGVKGTLEQEINLKPADGWTGVAIKNDYLVVWGFSTRKLVGLAQLFLPLR